MPIDSLPVGKLPSSLLEELLRLLPTQGARVLIGPGVGLDCAVVEASDRLLVFKSDPITFASDSIGWYAVQVGVNDIVTTGATPRWMLVTLLLPETGAQRLVLEIGEQLQSACNELGLIVIGGHTEVTYGLDRPILVGTMIGEVSRECLVTPRGAQPGDRLLLTKGVPIEATAILAREFPHHLSQKPGGLTAEQLEHARDFLHQPGISIQREALAAVQAGRVHAMHDPTEGGLYTALWELAVASQHTLRVDLAAVPVFPLSRRICELLRLDPLAAIASGALLLAAAPAEIEKIILAIHQLGIECAEIGLVTDETGPPTVKSGFSPGAASIPRPARDEIARYYSLQKE